MAVKPPVYLPASSGGACCSICGALVDNTEKHDSFHAALARMLGLDDFE